MELNKVLNPKNHKNSFHLRLLNDPQSNCNKFITKCYSLCVSLLNISMKTVVSISISVSIIFIILSNFGPGMGIKDIKNALANQNASFYGKE